MCQKINNRLNLLRSKMLDSKIDAIIVPLSDPHSSEYMASYWQQLQWVSGFTGSAGTVLITHDHAGLWTDGRYFLQAAEQLENSSLVLHKAGLRDKSTPLKWLKENIKQGAVIAMTGDMWSHKQVEVYEKELGDKQSKIKTDIDLIDQIWLDDRPNLPLENIFCHDVKYAGLSISEKIDEIRKEMKEKKVDWHLVTTLDDIGWITNLRGHDVEFNPVFIAYLLIGMDDIILYIDSDKVPQEVQNYLTQAHVEMKSYESVFSDMKDLEGDILVNPDDCNELLYTSITRANVYKGETISRLLKAIKNPTERSHIHNSMVKDGLALAHTFYWLKQHVDEEVVTEAILVDKLAYFRSQQKGYYGESFAAIVGYRGNGAIIHYRPDHATSHQIKSEGVLLCDSGGQYQDGTTDITRTMAMGQVSLEEQRAFSCVLKGHISLERIHFPEGTTGAQLDVLARQHLWQQGLNYNHGTGHGVGFFMNVHEPPQGYAPGSGSRATTALEVGMFSSNEPGYYKAGSFGIRIENLILVESSEHDGFLKHKNVTLYPIDKKMIVKEMMTQDEINWLNDYHDLVAKELCPLLPEEISTWLREQCTPFV